MPAAGAAVEAGGVVTVPLSGVVGEVEFWGEVLLLGVPEPAATGAEPWSSPRMNAYTEPPAASATTIATTTRTAVERLLRGGGGTGLGKGAPPGCGYP
jgi:hypothetical protein